MQQELTDLLGELRTAYYESDIQHNEYCRVNNRRWAYELIQTALVEHQPFLIGFNWGVDNTWEEYINGSAYNHQESIEKLKFVDIYKGSMQRSMSMCARYFGGVDFSEVSHSNFCFFQSKKEDQITEHDINLCVPIFDKMIAILNPSVVFRFSSKARDHMINHKSLVRNVCKRKVSSSDGVGNAYLAAKGELNNGSRVYFLPHPNFKLRTEARVMAWEFCSQ
jgi:uracil-DNA glycosylase